MTDGESGMSDKAESGQRAQVDERGMKVEVIKRAKNREERSEKVPEWNEKGSE